jgi:thiamine monophosphate kinase
VPTYAHHSFAATYFENQKVSIEGDLVQFMFRNPHSFVTVLAKDDKGEMQRWAVEWGAGGQLGRQGVTRDTLKPGDHVIITGDPSRTPGDHRLRMRNIVRPSDGWKWGGEFD